MTKVGKRKWLDYAGDRECGTEDRAFDVAVSLGIKNINSKNDAKQMNEECKRQNNPPAPSPSPSPEPEPLVESGPTFVGSNADGQGLTAAEFDLYSQQTMFGLQSAQQSQIQGTG
jgi:hypothetical protein